ncbi:golvesin C-terminal-like domain-containing protein [Micromonospora sp. CB01531]|uniref:golvesin C-terminal-like domain-containing protein n=1 Tax=Micromonospora sp. CB01531 TaxID=1718947 RepID=UPI001300F5D5|nr:DNRLRE domain-containing protein [Micromonospora sp. CB01531]
MEVLPDRSPDRTDRAADTSNADSGLIARLGDAARALVDGGPGRAKPEVISAGLAQSEKPPAARKWPAQKRVREVPGKRTANGRVYELSDGRLQAEISAVPVHYRDAEGRWQPIDTRVRPSGRDGYVQESSTNSFTSLFGGRSDNLVRFEQDGRAVQLGLTGGGKTATPKVDGSTVTYAGLAGGADLVYDVTSTALKEKIVLHRAPSGPVSYTFTLDSQGLVARQRGDGSIAFVRPDGGDPVFTMPAPFMYDAKADKSSPLGYVWSDQVTQRVQQMYGQTTITVSADTAWLADPARVYPVVIDPTIKIQPVPADAQDTQIYKGNPTHIYQNDDSHYQLRVGTDSTNPWRSLVKFNVGSIPGNTTIDDAQLQMYYDQTFHKYEYDVPIEARRITANWNEDTATWNNTAGNIDTAVGGNFVTLDNGLAGTAAKGTWTASTSTLTQYAVNGNYQVNSDPTTGDTYTWTPTLTEAGDYKVEVHYVGYSDRASNAPYTVHYKGGVSQPILVDQRTPSSKGRWVTLGTFPFDAGTTGKVVLGDVANKPVIADAVRFSKYGATKDAARSSTWMSFPVRNLVQQWVNGTPNYGVMLKAKDEATLNRGGPIFEASEYAYMNDRRDYNLPKLVVTYGRPGVTVNPPTTITSTGAVLDWPAYADPDKTAGTGDDIVEYQVHRSPHQLYTPSAATLIAPVSSSTRSFQDTTATPTPADKTNPMDRQFYYYMVAVKTADGQLIAGPTVPAMLPKAGQITKIFRTGVTDTTLSGTLKTTNLNVYDGDPYIGVGNNSGTYGVTRGVVKWSSLAGAFPAGVQITDAQLRMWAVSLQPGTDMSQYVDVYKLTRGFTETTATWNTYNGTNAWTTPGGDYDTSWKAGFNGFTNDPEWETWDVTTPVKSWVTTPSSNHGLLLRMRDEVNQNARAMMLASEAEDSMFEPTLEVTYLEQTPESTYYAAKTPTNLAPAATYTTPVSVSNPTQAAWKTTDWELAYQWTRANGEPVDEPGAVVATPLPADIPAGGTVDLTARVKTPASTTEGNKRTDYVLNWELRNKLTGQGLSKTAPIGPLAQNVAVVEPTSDQLGLEKFYSYAGKNTGAGGTLMNNLYSGNTVWSYNAFSNPSRGLSTFVRLAYNSLDTSDTVAGYGWSLQASSLMRLGSPLDFHPNPNPTKITLTDGDGTSHWFTWDTATSTWKSPKGVHLYLEKITTSDCKPNTQAPKAWRLTKPDRTQFWYDCEGFLTSTVDNNGNEMVFTYEERKSNNKPTKFLKYITDPTGRRTLTIDYYTKGQTYDYINDTTWNRVTSATNLTNPKIIDHVKQVTDISGRKLTFTYTDKGLLGELVDGYGSSGTMGAPKVFKFAYDMTQGNKNVKLVKVTDPRNHSTEVEYNYPQAGDDPKWHWTTKSYKDRKLNLTQFAYRDPDATDDIETTVTDAENHATTYLMDGYGRPTETTNAKNQKTRLEWDDDHNVTLLEEGTEANKATSTWKYDPKTGYPTVIKDAEAVANGWLGTRLTYQYQLNGYVAELTEKISSENRKWTFGYTSEGDLQWVVDPVGNSTPEQDDYKTVYTYDEFGQMRTAKNARGFTTHYDEFDANGYPKVISDAKQKSTIFTYDERGQVKTVTDAYEKVTSQEYDTFGRPRENRVPKDQDGGDFIVTPAPKYDENDNVLESYAPNGAITIAQYDAADQLEYTLAPVDEEGDPQRKTSFTYDKVGNLKTTTEPKGNLTPEVDGDYVTTNEYDEIYQLTSATNAKGHKISYEYDNVGNLRKVIDPRKNATADTGDYTTLYEYDKAHRVTKVTDALGKFTTTTYDRDSVVTATTDQLGNTTEIIPDPLGRPKQVKVPHKNDNGTISYRTTEYKYDEVGNQTKVISPRGTVTPDPDDFTTETVYDELDRVKETRTAYDGNDARYNTADVTTYEYDDVGRLATVSMPPSAGESVRNDTVYSYFDNGWTKTSRDPWDILTTYDYNKLGAQTKRTLTPAGEDPEEGLSNRTMTWSYFLDGKLATRSDSGVPVGRQVVLVDNSDFNNTAATGTWATATAAEDKYGHTYATRPAGTGANTFTWQLNVPQGGTYEVFARYPTISGAATDAKYTVNHGGGDTVKTVNQSTNTGTWVSLGSYSFTEGNTHKVSLSDQATGTVIADAVKLVRDNTGEADNEKADYTYRYDPNGNLKTITDSSPHARADTFSIDYTDLNQVQTVTESKSGTEKNTTTTFTYNENSAPLTTTHDKQYASYGYDERDLVSTVVNGKSATDPDKKTTTFTYTDRSEKLKETKGNSNTVDYTYYLDGLLNTQIEKKSNGTLVSEHTYAYDLNGNRTRDDAKKMNADNHSAYLNTTSDYTYDPRDRLATLTKTGDGAGTETYIHDANNNVIDQTIKSVRTTFNYDRNRLLTASTAGATSSYNYDPFGRLDTVTAAGTVIERNVYDGFDHIIENRKNNGTSTTTTKYTYDPLDRTATKTTDDGGAKERTTTFNYLGLSSEVLDEEVAGKITKSYQYSPWGQRLSQVTHKDDGTEEKAYYGYDKHTDVEQLTDDTGDTKATYGYTAYGKNDEALFTGIDKPDAADLTKEPYNVYRFNAKRWDQNSQSYDMGFRDYSPGLNRFLSRDTYNGALADMNLGLNPFTGNRYAFGGGNPISMIEHDGHIPCEGAYSCSGDSSPAAQQYTGRTEDGRPYPDTSKGEHWTPEYFSEFFYGTHITNAQQDHAVFTDMCEKVGEGCEGLDNRAPGVNWGHVAEGAIALLIIAVAPECLAVAVACGTAIAEGTVSFYGYGGGGVGGAPAGAAGTTGRAAGGVAAADAATGWVLPAAGGGAKISGRWYTEHALERMAPNTPEVMALLEQRAMARAKAAGLRPGTAEFGVWWGKNGPSPRNIPPSVVEAEIANPGSTGIRVITNDKGDVVTVYPR